MMEFFHYNQPLTLESGEILPELTVAYSTYGSMNAAHDNVIWVCHAYTANSEVDDWWPHTVEEGRFLDPAKHFIVCANILGSHYGTTGPLHINPQTGRKWYSSFPMITVRDMVRCHQLLAEYLGIKHLKMLIGSSLGGYQCMEWSIMQPDFVEKLVLIATAPQTTPWCAAFETSIQMVIKNDPTWGEDSDDAAKDGMSVGRSVAMLSYRGGSAYNLTQKDADDDFCFERRVATYQQHQGNKFKNRFNAYSLVRISQAACSHNVARGRGSVEEALQKIKADTLVISISSDILFPPEGHKPFIDNIPSVRSAVIDSDFGHDGFLIEHELLNNLINNFLE